MRTFPKEVRGNSSQNMILFGHLKAANRPLQKLIMSAPVAQHESHPITFFDTEGLQPTSRLVGSAMKLTIAEVFLLENDGGLFE